MTIPIVGVAEHGDPYRLMVFEVHQRDLLQPVAVEVADGHAEHVVHRQDARRVGGRGELVAVNGVEACAVVTATGLGGAVAGAV